VKRKEIEFNAEDLVSSVETLARHAVGREKITLRTKTLTLPRPVKPIKPKEIVAIREQLAVSQAVFAQLLKVPKVTEISWEKGRGETHGRRPPTVGSRAEEPQNLAGSLSSTTNALFGSSKREQLIWEPCESGFT